MILCVGAVSRRVVEEAAKLGVYQIVASRHQVDLDGGYTGMNQEELVKIVKRLSGDRTRVARDHGGPLQGVSGDDDYGLESFDADVEAGFEDLHIDVCKLPDELQASQLHDLCVRYQDAPVTIEIGAEHGTNESNLKLADVARRTKIMMSYVVINVGTYVWNDEQQGRMLPLAEVARWAQHASAQGVRTKMHNADWFPLRRMPLLRNLIDAYNVAPEYALLETDLLLTVLPWERAEELLTLAYASLAWRRWFRDDEGTTDQRARCAVRYVMNTPQVRELVKLNSEQESYVRNAISDVLARG